MDIAPEFIIKTLQKAYAQYDIYVDIDRDKALKIYGFCDALEKLLQRFAPEKSEELRQMRTKSKISTTVTVDSTVNLDEPTWLRNNIFN